MKKMESESGTMLPEKVTSTASESRKTSKPIMEKRRRARINASLAELKSLLLEVMKKEGSRQNKMEKADILEITVNHLRQLQKQQFSALAASDPSLINKYRLGFNECANEVGKILGSMEGVDTEARAKLLGHLANCMVSSDIGNSSKPSPPAPETHVDDFSDKCNRKQMHFHMSPINSSPPSVSQTNCRGVVGMETMLTLPPQEQVVTSTVSSSVMTIPSGHIPVANVTTAPQLQLQNHQHTIQQQPVVQQPNQQVQQQQVQMPKLVSGVQVIPTKMPTGEMAFIIPANFLTSGQTPNYVIPVLPSQNVQPAHAQFPTATVAPMTVVQSSVVKNESSIPSISLNTSPINLIDSKPIISICRNNNFVSETGLSIPNTSPQKNPEGRMFDHVHTASQFNILPAQETDRRPNDNNNNHHGVFQPKDDSMWRPW